MTATGPYYQSALARVHHSGYTFQANRAAPGIVALLEPVKERSGVVLELGCGSGLLTRHLLDAGHEVIATDASPAMLEVARHSLGADADLRLLTLPDDSLPPCDAVVSIGQVLSYLPDETAIDRALVAIATALRPGGVLAIDLFDLRLGNGFTIRRTDGKVADDWAIVTRYDLPRSNRLVNEHTVFVKAGDGTWRREDEIHTNVLLDTARIPDLLAEHGVVAEAGDSFAGVKIAPPTGVTTVVGHRPE